MPIVSKSTYSAPWYSLGAHGQTILPNVSRRRIKVAYDRERVELSDGDFIDLDWVAGTKDRKERCVLVLHGLEGHSGAPYMKSMLRSFSKAGYAAAAMNLRGCSGEPNRKLRSYHSGCSEDLREVIESVYRDYGSVFLVGFSLGGNIVLKFLGEEGKNLNPRVKAAVGFSVPCDLAASALALESTENVFYMKRFIRLLGAKVMEKASRFPDRVDGQAWKEMQSFAEFDNFYTAPMNGFKDAQDYWTKASSKPLLGGIKRPTLLINAANDPFLSDACYPREAAEANDSFFLETPATGGHCGFPGVRGKNGYWIEDRALRFFEG